MRPFLGINAVLLDDKVKTCLIRQPIRFLLFNFLLLRAMNCLKSHRVGCFVLNNRGQEWPEPYTAIIRDTLKPI
jgi:hypothetical protein